MPATKYTAEQLAFIKEEFLADPTKENVRFLAEKFGTTVRSIASRLTVMGVYKKPVYTTKTGERPVPKDEIIEYIAGAIGIPSEKLDGLEKAPKSALRLILKALDKNSDDLFKPNH